MDAFEIRGLFENGYDCGQVVFSYFAEELGLDEEIALKIAAGLGGGMFGGDSCGAVVGAVLAIGLKYGHYEEEDFQERQKLCMAKTDVFGW